MDYDSGTFSHLPHQPVQASNRPSKIQDVARAAGVSAMTVSRAINHPERLNPETLQRVRDAIASMRYVPNALASGLRLSRARLVAALLPTLVGPVFQELIQSLDHALNQHGYQLMIGRTGYDAAQEADLIRAIIQRRPDGIVMIGMAASEEGRALLQASRIPVVETWDLTDSAIDMLVGFSHSAIGQAVAAHFIGNGHRQLGMVSGDDARARVRVAAYAQAAQAAGLPEVTVAYTPAPSTLGGGRRGLAEILAQRPKVTAVFCSSDTLALGALVEAQHQGLQVPQQLAVVGLGDQEFAKDTDPPLTTVRLDGTRIGQLAADMIVARTLDQPVDAPRVDIGFSITQRSSG